MALFMDVHTMGGPVTFVNGISVTDATGTTTINSNNVHGNNVDTVPANNSVGIRLINVAGAPMIGNDIDGFTVGVEIDPALDVDQTSGHDPPFFQKNLPH